jgi:predicted O-linked N-acetylglucosamine transferase (SPINDLY family)
LNVELIAGLDKDLFELVVFTTPGPADDPIARRIAGDAAKLVTLPDDFRAARDAIAAEALEILYYPEIGMDVRTYFLAFARLAPVQCAGWGHPDTTGIPNIDYFVSSDLLEPDNAVAQYSETLVKLATLPTCYARPSLSGGLKGKGYFGLPDDRRIYLCPQSAIKLHPDFDQVVRGIVAGDTHSEVVLIEGAVAGWTESLLARLGAPVRVVPRQNPTDYLHLLAAADVILDTPHFSGGNTSYEAFALGKPIVTHEGALMRGRVTAAMYRIMDIEDAIAPDLDSYVKIAIGLGKDENFRDELSARIAAASDALFENAEAVREWEKFFCSAMENA